MRTTKTTATQSERATIYFQWVKDEARTFRQGSLTGRWDEIPTASEIGLV